MNINSLRQKIHDDVVHFLNSGEVSLDLSHVGVFGNETTDQAAKEVSTLAEENVKLESDLKMILKNLERHLAERM